MENIQLELYVNEDVGIIELDFNDTIGFNVAYNKYNIEKIETEDMLSGELIEKIKQEQCNADKYELNYSCIPWDDSNTNEELRKWCRYEALYGKGFTIFDAVYFDTMQWFKLRLIFNLNEWTHERMDKSYLTVDGNRENIVCKLLGIKLLSDEDDISNMRMDKFILNKSQNTWDLAIVKNPEFGWD